MQILRHQHNVAQRRFEFAWRQKYVEWRP